MKTHALFLEWNPTGNDYSKVKEAYGDVKPSEILISVRSHNFVVILWKILGRNEIVTKKWFKPKREQCKANCMKIFISVSCKSLFLSHFSYECSTEDYIEILEST